MPIVGSFAGASSRAYGLQAGVQIGDFESIATVTVGAGGASNVEFTSIPQTYTHLQIRSSALVNASNQNFQFNTDTGSNYYYHVLFGNGGSASTIDSGVVSAGYYGYSGTNSQPIVAVLDILDYANTNKFKTVRALSGEDMNGSGYAFLSSSLWRSTSAITSMKLFPSSNTFEQYSSFALYGIKG